MKIKNLKQFIYGTTSASISNIAELIPFVKHFYGIYSVGGIMFSDRLQEALKKRNISGNALCRKLGIDNKNYSNWNNNKIPRGETLKEIAEVLEVSTDWLLEKEGAPEPDEVHLLENYRICDEAGKETIISIAELQAKRCRKDKLKPFA